MSKKKRNLGVNEIWMKFPAQTQAPKIDCSYDADCDDKTNNDNDDDEKQHHHYHDYRDDDDSDGGDGVQWIGNKQVKLVSPRSDPHNLNESNNNLDNDDDHADYDYNYHDY